MNEFMHLKRAVFEQKTNDVRELKNREGNKRVFGLPVLKELATARH